MSKKEISTVISELVSRFDLVSSKNESLGGVELTNQLAEYLSKKKKDSVDEKKRKFWALCQPFITATNKSDVIEFAKYWCEVQNELTKPLSTKVRYEDETTFSIKDRISTWLNRKFLKQPFKQQTPDKESKKIDTSNLF